MQADPAKFSKTIAVIAHGNSITGAHSHRWITIVTGANNNLSFSEAKDFIAGNKALPEYQSSGLGEYKGLKDAECLTLVGQLPGVSPKDVPKLGSTNKVVQKKGYPVYVLRYAGDKPENMVSMAEMGVYAGRMKANILLIACRSPK